MAAVNPPFVIQDQTHASDIFRRMVRALRIQQGVVNSGDMAVSQNGSPNMSVNVAAGLAVVDGTQDVLHQGSYVCLNDATVNLAISAADPTNPRIDIVVAKVQDSQYSGATDAWSLAVVTGAPAPSPSAPAAPANSVILAQVAVAALASSITNANITDQRAFAQGNTPILWQKKSGALATYDFTSIPQNFSEIELRYYLRDTTATVGVNGCLLTFNGDSAADYLVEQTTIHGATVTAVEALTNTSINLPLVGGGSTAGLHAAGVCDVHGYSNSVLKAVNDEHFTPTATTTGNQNKYIIGAWWNNAAAISRLTLAPTTGFDANSYCELWLIP